MAARKISRALSKDSGIIDVGVGSCGIMTEAIAERMVRSFLDLFVLSILRGESMHGYQIIKELRTRTHTKIGAGSLYPLLYELEARKLVYGQWASPTRRNRRVYKITENGERYMEEGFRSIDQVLQSIDKSNRNHLHSTSKTMV